MSDSDDDDSGDPEDRRYRPPIDYKKYGFSHFRPDDVTDHEEHLIIITTKFYNITQFNDVGTDTLTQIINEITECQNFLPHPAKESRLSDKALKLQAKFNEYFEKYPSINRDDEHKKKLLGKVKIFFNKKKEINASGYKRKTSKKSRKRRSLRKKYRKQRTRRTRGY